MSVTVTIASSGACFTVEAGETILDAALRQDVPLPHGCRHGICGACISHVISGRIDYPDGAPMALFDAEAGTGLCCVGRPSGDLVIDPVHAGEDFESWE